MNDVLLILACLLLLAVSVLLFCKAKRSRRGELWAQRLATLPETNASISLSLEGYMDDESFLKTKPEKSDAKTAFNRRQKEAILTSWGISSGRAHLYFLIVKIRACVVVMVGYTVVNGSDPAADNRDLLWYSYLIIAGVLGFFCPEFLLVYFSQRRKAHFENLSLDIVDLLMLTVEAGVTFDAALIEVCKSIRIYATSMARELEILSTELAVLPDREVALSNLVERTGTDTFRYLKVALLQGEKYGTPIVTSLRIVASESRQKALLKKEEKAGRLPVFLSIPLMIFILPPVVVISASPGFIQLMRSF